jgi:hypothetical protein
MGELVRKPFRPEVSSYLPSAPEGIALPADDDDPRNILDPLRSSCLSLDASESFVEMFSSSGIAIEERNRGGG